MILSTSDTREANNKGDATNDLGHKTESQQCISTIANAIDTYRHSRHSEESKRSKREKITIAVLSATAIFALLAAGAAVYSAWIFQGQLSEMRADSHLSERAFLNVEQLKVEQSIVLPPDRLTPEEDIGWQFSPIFENSGKTPAVNIRVVAVSPETTPSFYGVVQGATMPGTKMDPISNRDFVRDAPDDPDVIFSWPTAKMEEFLVKDFTYLGPNKATIPPLAVFYEFRVRQFQAWPWWFYFGSMHYDDFFGEPHISKFCFWIDPAAIGGVGKPKYWVAVKPCAHWNCMDDACEKDRAQFVAENSTRKEEGKSDSVRTTRTS